MEIKVCTTAEWSESDWETYSANFNLTFNGLISKEHFQRTYLNTIDGYSYHALLLNDVKHVVGSCTVIPINYIRGDEIIKIGQAVGVFILQEYRSDPLMLRRMYSQLKNVLIDNDIVAVLAVPNSTSYSYWKNIVKWRDVGDLPYYSLPIRIGNVIGKYQTLNFFSKVFAECWIFLNNVFGLFINYPEKKSRYELQKSELYYKYRYSEDYKIIHIKNISFTYIIYDENGVKTAYLLEANELGKLTNRALQVGVMHISKIQDIDLILFVGALKLKQTVLFRVPKKFEPKRLPLTIDILLKEDFISFSDMFDFSNWSFGLINYDVR